MEKHQKKLLVVITEAAIERLVIQAARQLGALGYTISDVRGGGLRGEREGAWEADRSVELKFVCSVDIADRIAAHLLGQFAPNYAMTIWMADVQVFRAEKF
jgi:nitrogen regulatory protein P-II 2